MFLLNSDLVVPTWWAKGHGVTRAPPTALRAEATDNALEGVMQKHLAELRAKRAAGESGFTLIELLVVVVIIGILIAVAIPLYLNYQKGAKDKSASSDLRNAIAVLEQCNSDNSFYPNTAVAGAAGTNTYVLTAAAPTATAACTQVLNVSAGTTITYFVGTTTAANTAYLALATNTGGSGKTYCYTSTSAGQVRTTATVPTAYAATCPA